MKRWTATLIAILALAACTRTDQDADELGAAIYRTEIAGRTFTYSERADVNTTVRGAIADDYRYDVDVTRDGKRAASEVVIDDARALRITDAGLREQIGGVGNAALANGGWVVDPKGSNGLFDDTPQTLAHGTDPIHDSLAFLKYVRRAMGEAASVMRFNPESQDYRPKLDPFSPPSGGIVRYDLVPPALEPRDPSATGSALQLPGTRFFRRLAVYVDDGRIVRVRERISIEDMLNDPRSRLAARIGDYNIRLPRGSVARQAAFLASALNATASRLGQPGVRVRDLDVRFGRFDRSTTIALPTGAVRTSLAGVRDHGQILFERSAS